MPKRLMRWTNSLAGRTALALLIALVLLQTGGVLVHETDRVALLRVTHARNAGLRVAATYRALLVTPPQERAALLERFHDDTGSEATISSHPDIDPAATPRYPLAPPFFESMRLVPLPTQLRPSSIVAREGPRGLRVSVHMPDGDWLNLLIPFGPPRLWHSSTPLFAYAAMTLAAGSMIVWGVRRLTEPMRVLARAADALGRDVNAPALPEDGPVEVATAAKAFNRMAERIRRFVSDRTLLLAAIGHDLRTPITRLKLRTEFIEDEEQRVRFLADLNELETMVSATLAFGRDAASGEPLVPLDLPELLRTILDELGDAWPDAAERLSYEGPAHFTYSARSVALKRALTNLIANAVKYGGDARVRLTISPDGPLLIRIEDSGPGIPPDEISRVFEPFYRVERSRNRETGGTGLGLPIARNILRAHGGDIVLANRAEGGLRTTISLPNG